MSKEFKVTVNTENGELKVGTQTITIEVDGKKQDLEVIVHDPNKKSETTRSQLTQAIINGDTPTITTKSSINIIHLADEIISKLKEIDYEGLENVIKYLTTNNISRENAKLVMHMMLRNEKLKTRVIANSQWVNFAKLHKQYMEEENNETY